MLTIKKAVLISILFCASLLRGRVRGTSREINRVLVVQMAKLGDMVCTTPMFRALKEKYPHAKVHVLGNAINKEVVAYNQDVDDYIVFEGFAAAVRRLKSESIDAAVVAGAPDFFSIAAAFLAGVPRIVGPQVMGGHAPQNDWWYKRLSSLITTAPHRMGHYAPREYLKLLEPLGIHASDTTKHLAYSAEANDKADSFIATLKRPLVGISPSAGNKVKEWPADRFAAVADALKRDGATVIIIGGRRDANEVNAMLAHTQESHVNALNKFSIDELKAVISKLDLFVSVDTGPIYIAEAFEVATVDITGPIDEREQPPVGDKHIVVTPSGPRAPQLFVLNAKEYNYKEARRQAESITVAIVHNACKSIIMNI